MKPIMLKPQGVKLTGRGESGDGDFGQSVALSGNGDTALIGGDQDDYDEHGAVWAFTRSGAAWTQQGAKLTANGEVFNGGFGFSVALSTNGNTALISAPDGNGDGAVWVFTRSGSTWTQGVKLTGSGETGNAGFGESMALSTSGNTALIAGAGNDGGSGAVWVFTRSGSTWTQQGPKLTGSDENAAGGSVNFGTSVALSGDGNTALVGGGGDNNNTGAVWVFTRSGSTWTQQGRKLTVIGEPSGGEFGSRVALSADGSTALIGDYVQGHGAVWVFTRSGSTWTQGTKLTGTGSTSGDIAFGFSVALSADGDTALVGATNSFTNNTGAAWVFTRSGSSWTRGERLIAAGETGGGHFGSSVALSTDGNTAMVGAPDDSPPKNNPLFNGIGAAWVFDNE